MASSIVLADAQGTPVNHTFVPIGYDKNGVFWFEDQSAASAIGNWRISLALKRPPVATARQNSEGRSNRVRIEMHQPVLETVSNSTVSGIVPAPTVSYTPRNWYESVLPERTTLLDRKNARKMMAALLADTQVIAVLETLAYVQ